VSIDQLRRQLRVTDGVLAAVGIDAAASPVAGTMRSEGSPRSVRDCSIRSTTQLALGLAASGRLPWADRRRAVAA
jgi:hypothetical protein